jgi:hypothetical protein
MKMNVEKQQQRLAKQVPNNKGRTISQLHNVNGRKLLCGFLFPKIVHSNCDLLLPLSGNHTSIHEMFQESSRRQALLGGLTFERVASWFMELKTMVQMAVLMPLSSFYISFC